MDRGLPVAIPETAALLTEGTDPTTALDIKRAWWQQVLSDATLDQLPALRMVNWFDWAKHEPEVGGRVDWSVTADPAVATAFTADAPTWVTGERRPTCARDDD